MTLESTGTAITVILGILAILGVLLGWVRFVRPRWRRFWWEVRAIRDALLGRDAIMDSITGTERLPAQPGMGVRMASVEENQTRITEALLKLADSHERINDHEERIKHLHSRVDALEAGSVERVVARAESTQAWRTVQAAIEAEPGDKPDLD